MGLLQRRFIAVQVERSAAVEGLLKRLDASDAADGSAIIATPRGSRVDLIGTKDVQDAQQLAQRLAESFGKYQDRVLFGKDSFRPEEFPTYFRVLESDDEYFPYYKRYHAFWRMYGLALPDNILKKLYYKNALKLLPHLDEGMWEDQP